MTYTKTISTDRTTEDRILEISTAVARHGVIVTGADIRRISIKLLYDMLIDMETKGMKYSDMFIKEDRKKK